jgi:hypothetical protein
LSTASDTTKVKVVVFIVVVVVVAMVALIVDESIGVL